MMPEQCHPRRSFLYLPGDRPRALEKARTLAVDGVLIDLEEAVAPENRAIAREVIAQAVGAGGYGERALILRVSSADSVEDFVLAEALPLDGVLLPKVERPDTVVEAARRTRHPIWCMIETPLGVIRASDIAGASDCLAGLVVGSSDLTKELRARHTPDRAPLLASLSLILLAARAHGLAAIDGAYPRLDDAAGFEASCRQGVELGFDGKSLIHPSTIEAANRIFAPAPERVEEARRMVAAWEAAQASGPNVVRIANHPVDQPQVDEARRLVVVADAIARREQDGRA